MAYWLGYKVYDSWAFNDLSQGILVVPLWIPQLSLPLGAVALALAIADELIAALGGSRPSYQVAAEERSARGDYSETL
jgi:TRAP-type C4-dicarboxylate transport system permease small subunit